MTRIITTLVIALLVMTAQAADPFLGCVLGKTTKSDAKQPFVPNAASLGYLS